MYFIVPTVLACHVFSNELKLNFSFCLCSRDVYALCPNKVSENNQLVSSKATVFILPHVRGYSTASQDKQMLIKRLNFIRKLCRLNGTVPRRSKPACL